MLPVSAHDLIITVLTVPATNLGSVVGLSFQVLHLLLAAASSTPKPTTSISPFPNFS